MPETPPSTSTPAPATPSPSPSSPGSGFLLEALKRKLGEMPGDPDSHLSRALRSKLGIPPESFLANPFRGWGDRLGKAGSVLRAKLPIIGPVFTLLHGIGHSLEAQETKKHPGLEANVSPHTGVKMASAESLPRTPKQSSPRPMA